MTKRVFRRAFCKSVRTAFYAYLSIENVRVSGRRTVREREGDEHVFTRAIRRNKKVRAPSGRRFTREEVNGRRRRYVRRATRAEFSRIGLANVKTGAAL